MTARRTTNLIAVVLPPVAIAATAVAFWGRLLEPIDLVVLAAGYG